MKHGIIGTIKLPGRVVKDMMDFLKYKKYIDNIATKGYNIVRIQFRKGGMKEMTIRPSAAIRQNYNEISELCKKSGEPVYLTKNGEGDLVVMDIEAFDRREKMLKLREELLAVEEERLHGDRGYTVKEVGDMMRNAVKEAANDGKS